MPNQTTRRYESTATAIYPEGYGSTIPASPNFVPAQRVEQPARSVVPTEIYMPLTAEGPTSNIEGALQAQGGQDERTSGMDRSKALILRMIPLSLVWLVLSIGVTHYLATDWSIGVILFAIITALTYLWFDRQERQFSRAGLERHRIDRATQLKMAELQHDYKLRKMLLGHYMQLTARTEHD